MKVTIVFHSVCGNTYLMGKEIYDNFVGKNVDVNLYRVKDDDLEAVSDIFPVVKEYLEDIEKINIIENIEELLDSDYVFLGSPTYFGNVSAEMKAFMDSFSELWMDAKLQGKKLVAFGSSSTPEGGGGACLEAINRFGQHMGMYPMAIPANLVSGISNAAYGLLHYSGENSDRRLDRNMKRSIKALVDLIIKE